MQNQRFAVVDIETSGGDPKRERITEIAIYLLEGGKSVEEFDVSFENEEKEIVRTGKGVVDILEKVEGADGSVTWLSLFIIRIYTSHTYFINNDYDSTRDYSHNNIIHSLLSF